MGRLRKRLCCQVGLMAWADTFSSCSKCCKQCYMDLAKHRWCTAQMLANALQTAAMSSDASRGSPEYGDERCVHFHLMKQQAHPWAHLGDCSSGGRLFASFAYMVPAGLASVHISGAGVTDTGRGTMAGDAAPASARAGPSEAGPLTAAGLLLAPPSLGSQAASSEAPHGAPIRSPEAGGHDQPQPGSIWGGSLQPGSSRTTELGMDTGAHGQLLEGGGGAVQADSGMFKGTGIGATSLPLDGRGWSLDMGAAPPCQLPKLRQAPHSAAGDSSAAAAEGDAPGEQEASWQQARAPARPPAVVDSGQAPAAAVANPALRRAGVGSDAAAAASSIWGGQASPGAGDPSEQAADAGWAEMDRAGASPPELSAANAGAGSRGGQSAAVMEDPAASAPRVSTPDSAAGSNHGQASASSSAEPRSSGSFRQQSVAHDQSTAFSFGGPSQQPPTRWQSTAANFGDAGLRSAQVLNEQNSSRIAHQPPSRSQSAATQQLPLRDQRMLSSTSQGSALRSEGQLADDGAFLLGGQDSARLAQRPPPTRYQSAVSAFGDAMEGTSAVPGGQTAAPAAEEAGAGFDSRQALQAAAAETALTLGLCDGSGQQEGPACTPEQAAADSLQQSRAVTEPQSVAEDMHVQPQGSAACLQAMQEEPEPPDPQQGSTQSGTSQTEQRSGPREAAGQAASGDSHSSAVAARSPELAALLARAAAFCDRPPQQSLVRCACSALFTSRLRYHGLSCDRKFPWLHRRPQPNLLICTCRLLPPVLA